MIVVTCLCRDVVIGFVLWRGRTGGGELVCDSLVDGRRKAGSPGAVGLGIFGRAGNCRYGNALTRWWRRLDQNSMAWQRRPDVSNVSDPAIKIGLYAFFIQII